MIDLKDRFTDNQIKKLKTAGINSLYEFVTFLPYNYYRVLPMGEFSRGLDNVKYLTNATLTDYSYGRGRRYLTLEFSSDYNFRCYFFASANYITKTLKKGSQYQLLLTFKNNFWVLQKFSQLKDNVIESNILNLGTAKIKNYLDVVYSQSGGINGNYIKSLHKRLQPADYLLSFVGLVPQETDLIPQHIDLKKIHFPQNVEQFIQTNKDWLSVKVFLKLALIKYANSKTEQKIGRAATIDSNYLKQISSLTGFELSKSQQEVVWDILQELGEVV